MRTAHAQLPSLRRGLAYAAVLATLNACMMFAKPPAELDYGRVRSSKAGLYRATIVPDGDSIPQGTLQKWTLHLETTNGALVDSAAVTVNGGMPRHGHGLPTKPLVTTSLGHGDHRVEGLKFNMGGWWVVRFAIRAPSGADTVVFNLKL
ncbi:MAG: FixH family protein [Gemmatimonadota bacterium]